MAGPQTGPNGPKIKNCITGRAGKMNYGPGRAENLGVLTSLPGTFIECKAFKCQTRAPFVIYVDIESVVEPIDELKGYTLLY